jgi:lipopolysaccharide export system protein LptA
MKVPLNLIKAFSLVVILSFVKSSESLAQATKTKGIAISHNSKLPTYIKSDSLVLDPKKRVFTYTGNVKVTQGDFTLICEKLDGFYNSRDQITRLDAFKNVVITKGENIEARSNKAVYLTADQVATLTENPMIIQGKSALSADVVKIFLETEKTEAQGKVEMKVLKEDAKQAPTS